MSAHNRIEHGGPSGGRESSDSEHGHAKSDSPVGTSPCGCHAGGPGRVSGSALGWFGRVLIWPLVMLIRFYQVAISPFTPAACRFYPTCSSYGLEALRRHGPIKGMYLTVRRILRCNPWGGSGYDPVP